MSPSGSVKKEDEDDQQQQQQQGPSSHAHTVKKEEDTTNSSRPATATGPIKSEGLQQRPGGQQEPAPEEDPDPEQEQNEEGAPERIQAYAKLEFPFFNFYIQKLSVTIGRRPPDNRQGSHPLQARPRAAVEAAAAGDGQDADDDKEQEQEEVLQTSAVQAEAEQAREADGRAGAKAEAGAAQAEQQQAADPTGVDGQQTMNIDVAKLEPPLTPHKPQGDRSDAAQTGSVQPPAEFANPDQQQQQERREHGKPATTTTTPTQQTNGTDAPEHEPVASTSALPVVASTSQEAAPAAAVQASPLPRFPGNKVHVDVDLGPIKAVSRDHARLFFDSTISPRTGTSYGWSIEVRGRNGLVLDGKWRAKSEIARLTNRCVRTIRQHVPL